MKLCAPIFRLKRRARLLSRAQNMPLAKALDRVARDEGFARWSLLAARAAEVSPAKAILSGLDGGDLLLLGARPGHGKTTLGLQLLLDAAREGRKAIFFSLFMSQDEIAAAFRLLEARSDGGASARRGDPVSVVTSDAIDADFIIAAMAGAAPGTIAVIDYLQILDEQRSKPDLSVQIARLRDFARRQGVVLAFLSQIDRSYDPAERALPDMRDIRLPNRIDPAVFSKTCFLHDGEMRFQAVSSA